MAWFDTPVFGGWRNWNSSSLTGESDESSGFPEVRLAAPARKRARGSKAGRKEVWCSLIVWWSFCLRTLREPRHLVVVRLRVLGAGSQMASAEGQWNLQGPQERKALVLIRLLGWSHIWAALADRGTRRSRQRFVHLVPSWLSDNR